MSRKLLRAMRKKETPDLDITAFMNLMVALVPFLLVTAVFSRVSILQLDLPAAVGEGDAANKPLTVEVIVRKDRIEIGDGTQIVSRIGNLEPAASTPPAEGGDQPGEKWVSPAERRGYDLVTLNRMLREIKSNYPSKLDATVLLEPDLEYEILVQVMDTVSTVVVPEPETGLTKRYDLFPQISVGDAPVVEG